MGGETRILVMNVADATELYPSSAPLSNDARAELLIRSPPDRTTRHAAIISLTMHLSTPR